MIQFPSMVPVPKQFTVLSNEVLEDDRYGILFRMHLSCTCGKQPYLNMVVDSVEALATPALWRDLWDQMLIHEKAETLAEGGTWQE